MNMEKVGVLLLATLKYKQFVGPLIEDIKKYFVLSRQVEVYLFTDDLGPEYYGDGRVSIVKELIPAYRFPEITTLRYKIFTGRKYPECSHLFYMDVDMAIRDHVGEEILHDLVAVLHPGFSMAGGGSWCTNPESTGYTLPQFRKNYFAGGFQGGSIERYYRAMQSMKRHIDEDEKNGTIPEWHDEGIWNKYLSDRVDIKILNSSYCMVEEMEKRIEWKIQELPAKIIALAKNHEEIRN